MKGGNKTLVKLGNLSFIKEAAQEMTYTAFVKAYKDVLKGITLDKAAKELGIKVPTKKDKKED